MDHLAILDKKRKLLDKIISGEKTIESRWYKFKRTPYGVVKAGETIYFKESGQPVTVKATVAKALFFDFRHTKVQEILQKYAAQICLQERDPQKYGGIHYCTLMFLKDVTIIEPFHVDKTGYGMMSAWISVDNINRLRKTVKN